MDKRQGRDPGGDSDRWPLKGGSEFPSRTSILVVEPEEVNRHRLVRILDVEPSTTVAGEGGSFPAALASSSKKPSDILLINIDDSIVAEAQAWAFLKTSIPIGTPIIGLSTGENSQGLQLALIAGLASLQPIAVPGPALIRTIREVSSGQASFDSELLARAKQSLLPDSQRHALKLGGLYIDLRQRTVRMWGLPINLTAQEFNVLEVLARNPGRVVRVPILLDEVWNASIGSGGTRDQVKSCIKRLQKKLEPDPSKPRYICWDQRGGYRLDDPYG